MRGVAGDFVEFHARQNAHRDANFAALFNGALQANVVPFLGDRNPLEVSPTRLERLGDCVDSVENVHVE